jgi:hypothetical protein
MIYLHTKCHVPDMKVSLVIILKQKTTKSFTYLPCYSVLYKNMNVTKVEIFFQNVVRCSTKHREVSAKFHVLDSVMISCHPQPYSYGIFWEATILLYILYATKSFTIMKVVCFSKAQYYNFMTRK